MVSCEEDGIQTMDESLMLLEEPKQQVTSPWTEENFRKLNDFSLPMQEVNWKTMFRGAACSKASFLSLIPIFNWLPLYDFKNHLIQDIAAGLTVSVLQIPQGLAFAPLGGQPPVVGLYMAVFPVLVYFVFGTSRHISLGMFAVTVMMVGKIVETHATPPGINNGTDVGYSAMEVGIAATFTVGFWQLLLGIMRLGCLCVLLSNSLVSGFTSGASIHIIVIQLKHIFGIPLTMTSGPLKLIFVFTEFFKKISQTNLIAFGISSVFVIILFVFNECIKPVITKRCRFPIPMEFLLIVIGIILSNIVHFDSYDVRSVGTIPSGLPHVLVPPISLMPALAADCLIIALVNISVNISMAKVFAKKGGYVVRENQELFAYGLSNMLGGFFQCLPVCASFSRSMVQFAAGGKTEMAHLVGLISVLIMLLFFGPLFETVPLCILAAIVTVTLKGLLIQVTEFPGIWRASKVDGTVWLVTFMSVVLLDVDYGIGVGLIASVVALGLISVQAQVLILN